MIYHGVTDADATTQAVEHAGGTVRVAPTDLDDWGRMAQPGGGGTYSLITPAGLPEDRMQGSLMELPEEHLGLAGGRPCWHRGRPGHRERRQRADGARGHGVRRPAVCLDPSKADFVVLTPARS